MTDPRSVPANTRVIAAHLGPGKNGQRIVTGEAMQVSAPLVDLLRGPAGRRDRQLLLGDSVTVYEDHEGWSFVQAAKDGYCGYLPSAALAPRRSATHWIAAPSSHVYEQADIKSPERMTLSFGCAVFVQNRTEHFAETPFGFVPSVHLRDLKETLEDPIAVATLFLGTPYLWGGNSRWGIDCSGLVQAALLACGQACPGDSDLQMDSLGEALPKGTRAQRGDLIFWKGHVAWVVAPDRILHANAHDMAVAYEPLSGAIARIEAQGEGPVLAHKRL
ncbi:C40 family peptidase [Thalassococcus sp. S3]|uniref:C40 family peptidase n=1 Tax=Thalassococcus sp. S3 TaxID=2017482 RepID=UPI0010243FA7|nr:NlpC/P60 family protein [Thalassococcus sp. S3]QBF29905.1 NLP/P60 hydrolase [Thalassococcus sp. S3]